MSATDNNSYFVELGEYSLIIARTNLSQRPRAVDELREVWLGDNAAVDGLLRELKPAEGTPRAIALLRLKSRASFLSDAAQAKRYNTTASIEEFVRENLGAENTPASWSWATARDGRSPENGAPWVLDAVPTTAADEAVGKLKGWAFELQRCQSASLSSIGALSVAARAAQANAPILLCDITETRSFLYSITAQGVSGFATAAAGFDSLAEATQGALGLKFRGSAARLLFNESYDFTDSAAKIAEPLANAIRAALPSLGSPTPTQIVCTGLLAKQAWIVNAISAAIGLKPFAADAAAWSSAQGLSLAGSIKAEEVSPSWLGVLGAVAAYDPRNPGAATPWNPVLTNTPVAAAPIVPAIAPEPPPPPPKPAVVITPPPAKPAEIPAIKPEPPAPKPAAVITPPAKPAEPAKPAVVVTPPPAKPAEPVKPAVAAKNTPPAPAAAKAGDNKGKAPEPVKPAPKPAPAPVQKAPAKPAEPAKPAPAPVKPVPAPAVAKPATVAPFPQKKNNLPMIIGAVVLVVVLAGGFFFYQSKQSEKQAAEERQRKELEQRAAAEAAARRAAEEKATAEAAARKKAEEEAAARAADAEKKRIQAEEDTRKQTTERLLSARGSLALTTDPVGATVVVGELAPRPSPVKLENLRLGHYSLTITLSGYDTEQRDVEIKENEATDLGTIKLRRQVGSMDISSEPSGLTYEIKPAGVLFVNPSDVRSGQTPATVSDLPVGSYQVTISRQGWPAFVSTVNVERGAAAKVQGGFVGGNVVINSTPTGGTVMRDNQNLGTTPLTLNDLTPGNVTFTVTQKGLDSATVSGKIESGKTLTLNATLLDTDRVMKLSELDERPQAIAMAEPDLTDAMRAEGGFANISFVVGRDGVPADLKVVQASNPALGRVCLAAAAKWRFKPGSIKGKPVRSSVTIPFKIAPKP
jgi:TonB family protein